MARRGLICVAVIAAVIAASTANAQKRQKDELSRIQSELRKTLSELETLRASATTLNKDVSRLEDLDASSRARVEQLQAVIRRAENRKHDLKSRLDAASRVHEYWTAALSAEVLRHVATSAGRSDFYGTSEIWADEFRRTAILEKSRHLRGLKGFQKKTEKAEAVERRRAEELATSRRRVQGERENRRKEYEAKKAELERAQSQVAQAARRAKDLEENAKAMTALIEKLSVAAKAHKPAGVKATLDVPAHSLPWPTAGHVVTGFGREKDRELGTWTVHQGMTIATNLGAAVKSVAPGRVIFSGPFRSYGKVLIVDHGGGFFSVYGGLGDVVKEKGADVRSGERLANAGVGPQGSDGRVYLELRRGAEALDPAQWLEKIK